jgi:hypothetical protein
VHSYLDEPSAHQTPGVHKAHEAGAQAPCWAWSGPAWPPTGRCLRRPHLLTRLLKIPQRLMVQWLLSSKVDLNTRHFVSTWDYAVDITRWTIAARAVELRHSCGKLVVTGWPSVGRTLIIRVYTKHHASMYRRILRDLHMRRHPRHRRPMPSVACNEHCHSMRSTSSRGVTSVINIINTDINTVIARAMVGRSRGSTGGEIERRGF